MLKNTPPNIFNSVKAALLAWKTIPVLWIVLASPAFFYAYKQSGENSTLNRYLDEMNLSQEISDWEKAKLVSSKLREDFVIDESRFKHLDLSDRPFLRETSEELLEIREGLCGEGTRVLVNLLILSGLDATRISLYDRYLNSSHTLVSLQLDDGEYLIDSINTPEYTNNYINSNQINSESFQIVKYSDDVTKRMEDFRAFSDQNKNTVVSDNPNKTVEQRFYERFLYYSYEAIPYTKLAGALKLDTRVFNFDRPSIFFSSLAEKPYLIMVWFWIILSTSITLLIIALKLLFTAKLRP